MTGAAAAYVLGAFFVSFFTDTRTLLSVCSAIVIGLLISFGKQFKSKDYTVIAVFFALGLMVCGIYTAFCYNPVTAYNGQVCSFSGEITEMHSYGDSSSYILDGVINGKQKARITYYGDALDAEYGDVISIENCELDMQRSDFLFDSERYYKADGIFLRANNAEDVTLEHRHSRSIKNALMNHRDRMVRKFVSTLGNDNGGFLSGMVFGSSENVDSSIKTAVYRCGFGHILAVSGLHVSIIAFVLLFILKKLHVNRYVGFVAANLLIFALIIMAESPLSAIRAAIMTNFLMAARLFRRQNDVATSLSGAVLLICIAQPFSVLSAGFQMSVAGTFGIGIAAPYLTEKLPNSFLFQKLLRPLAAALITTLTVFPLSVYYFGETSLISPVMNVLIVPLCSVAMIVGVLYVLTNGILPVLSIAGAIIDFVLYISDKASHFHWTYLASDESMIITSSFGLAAITIIICVLAENRLLTSVVGLLSCAVIFIESTFLNISFNRGFRVAVLGRDNNAAVVITNKGYCEIIDMSGNASNADYVRKYLSVNGIERVDSLVLTKNGIEQTDAYFEALTFTEISYVRRFDDNTFEHDIYDCKIALSPDILSICYKDKTVNVLAKESYGLKGSCYYYGCRRYKETNGRILDSDTNNFELVPSETGFTEWRL